MEVKLRALEPEDLSVLYQIENDTNLWQYGASNTPISRYSLRQYISSCNNDIFSDGQIRFAIDVDDECAGLLDLTNFNPMHRRAEVGVVIVASRRQKGIAKKALELLLTYSKEHLGLHQLYALVSTQNNGALQLFSTVGFKDNAVLKEWLLSPSGERHDATLFQYFLD